ncbi:MAG: 2-phospho-L-lactate transferase [Betaproteobacteria bacterium]|nr:MAG: 2-phospho-L-lactate transferase [Betaproteobacteria bacterium]
MILALAGGVGGARLAHGLAQVLDPAELMIAVNTGDDFVHLGLYVAPDIDTVMYTLAGINDPQRGWGVADETWHFMEQLAKLGGETWFQLGDRDLATNVERTRRLTQGQKLSEVTRQLCLSLGVKHSVVPMSDERVRTRVDTDQGQLDFQDYFVRRRAEPKVRGFEYVGANQAQMSAALRDCLSDPALRAVIICPSNPYLSVAPILSIPGVRNAIANAAVPRLAISPIVGGQALKGPAAKIMRELGRESSVVEVARFYRGLIDALVIDGADASLSDEIALTGITPLVTSTVMRDANDRRQLAENVVGFCEQCRLQDVRSAEA